MTRQTSIEAYHAAIDSGLVSARRAQVLRIVAHFGPMTANECWNQLEKELHNRFRFDSNTRARFTELREMDLIDEVGTRDCSVTGRRCILWEISGRTAKPIPKKKTSAQEIEELKAEIVRLNKIIEKLTNDPQLPLFHVV